MTLLFVDEDHIVVLRLAQFGFGVTLYASKDKKPTHIGAAAFFALGT